MAYLIVNENTNLPIPSNIIEGVDILKNTERGLDGTLYVDFTNKKRTLEVSWGYLTKNGLDTILNAFPVERVIDLKYYNDTEEKGTARKFYADEISYTPRYINGELTYTDVVISLLEV